MIFRIQKRTKWATIDKRVLSDHRLSWKAKGILCYLLGHDDNWEVRSVDLENQGTDGRDSIYSALKELREIGYLTQQQNRSQGKFQGIKWDVHEEPNTGFPIKKIKDRPRETGFPDTGKPATANPSHTYERLKRKKDVEDVRSSTVNGFLKMDEQFSPFIKKTVATLETFIRTSRKISPQFKRSKWCREIELLLQKVNGDEERITKALHAYIELSDMDLDRKAMEYRPKVESAESFRDKFTKVEDWVSEHEKALPPPEPIVSSAPPKKPLKFKTEEERQDYLTKLMGGE